MENLIAGEELMVKDIRLKVDFMDHPKTVRLRRELGSEAIECLIRLWGFAADNRPKGELVNMDADDIEIAAKWTGEPGKFVKVLLQKKCKFLMLKNRHYVIHDWKEHQGFLYYADERSKKAKLAASYRWEKDDAKRMPPACDTDAKRMPPAQKIDAPSPIPTTKDKDKYKDKEKTLRDSDESTPLSLRRWFDEVMWTAVPSQKKKGKELTWAEIQKLKPDEAERKEIVTYLSSYYKIKSTYDIAGEFMAEMQDPVRVIRNRRYKDVLVPFRGKSKAGGMAPTSAEKNGEPYDRLGYLRLMSDKMKRWKLKMEGESFRRDLIEIGDDPAKYEEAEDAEH